MAVNDRPNAKSRAVRAKLLRATVIKHLIDCNAVEMAKKLPGPNDTWAVVMLHAEEGASQEMELEFMSGDDLTEMALDNGWDYAA